MVIKVLSRPEWQEHSRLVTERDRVTGLLADLRSVATSRSDYEPHDVGDDEAALLAVAVELRIASINKALDRMAADEYGHCVSCGVPIAEERRIALPATAVCRDCTP